MSGDSPVFKFMAIYLVGIFIFLFLLFGSKGLGMFESNKDNQLPEIDIEFLYTDYLYNHDYRRIKSTTYGKSTVVELIEWRGRYFLIVQSPEGLFSTPVEQ